MGQRSMNNYNSVEYIELNKVKKRKTINSRNTKSKNYLFWKEFEAEYGTNNNFHFKIKAVKIEDEWE